MMRSALVCAHIAIAAISAAADAQDVRILFASSRSGEGDIYAIPESGGDAVLVYGTEAPEGLPRYAPGSGEIFYLRFEPEGAYLMRGSRRVRILPDEEVAPHISADGSMILYSQRVGDGEAIFALSLEIGPAPAQPMERISGGIFRYPVFQATPPTASWAGPPTPSLNTLVVHVGEGESELRLHHGGRRSGDMPYQVLHTASYIGHPSYSPDARFIAVDMAHDGETDIAIIDAENGGVVRLIERPGNDFTPAWSTDGSRIAFGGVVDGDIELFAVALESGEITRLTNSPGFDGAPVFVPATALPD